MEYRLINDFEGTTLSIKLTDDNGQVLFIPLDEANTDYQEYIEWTKKSPANVAAPADE